MSDLGWETALHKISPRRALVGASAGLLLASGLGLVNATSASAASFPAACWSSVKITSSTSAITYLIPATPGGNTSCQLQQGNATEGVKVLQRSLNACYNAGLSVDGDFGRLTYNALVAAQRASGSSPVDGIYGPNTRDHLKWPTSASSNPCRIL